MSESSLDKLVKAYKRRLAAGTGRVSATRILDAAKDELDARSFRALRRRLATPWFESRADRQGR